MEPLPLARSLPVSPSFLHGGADSRSPLGTQGALSFAYPDASAAASEQFTGLLQSGYLGVDCSNQVRIVDRHIGLIYIAVSRIGVDCGDQFGFVHGRSGMAYPRLRCAGLYVI